MKSISPVGTTSITHHPPASRIKNDMPITWALKEIISPRFFDRDGGKNDKGDQHTGAMQRNNNM